MKKKVFSKLLMVALVATVGAFTSCKDYDDDINDLRSKVDGLNTSLTTLINEKVTTVSQQVNALEKQLKDVETAYAQADAALQKELDAAKETGKANADAIKTLQAEVVNLQTAKGQLEEAVKALQDGLATANANIKANGDEIIKLIAADKALEDKIATAQAAADNALKEAQAAQTKAGENATEIASLKTKEQADFDNLQKQISDNLTTVNAKIAEVNKALGDRIAVNETDIKALKDASTEYKADIKSIKDKVKALEDSDKDILAALDTAKKTLEQADADAAAAQKEVNDKLAAEIKANADAIDLINHVTLRDLEDKLVDEVIPAEVLKQLNYVLNYRLKKFFDEDVTTLVTTETGKNKALIDALDEKVDSIDEAINNYVDAQFLLVADAMDSISSAHDTKASQLEQAYKNADNLVKDSIGKVAAALESAKTAVTNSITAINNTIGKASTADAEATGMFAQIEALESWFAPVAAAEGEEASGLLKYQEELLKTEAVKKAVEDIVDAANGEINSMITSINLFANQHDAQSDWYGGFDHTLTFTYTIEKENVFPARADITDKQFTFEEGMYRSYSDSILVRVSPTNAILTKENIALLNSQGADIVAQNIIEVDSVAKFDRLLTRDTRSAATGNETGLWVIYFKMNDRKIGTDFEHAAVATVNGYDQKILYSIGVKNTTDKDNQLERYVVSEYDLDLSTAPAFPAWDFYVNGKTVSKIHNRYIETDLENVVSDDSTGLNKKTFRNEYTWIGYGNYEAPYANLARYYTLMMSEDEADQKYVSMVPATKMILEGENANTTDRLNHPQGDPMRGVDNRHQYDILPVTVGEPISIDFPEWFQFDSDENAPQNKWCPTPIKGFYVTLDHDFALESIPSEINAWTGYEYEGVGVFKKDNETGTTTITKATLFEGNHGTITIKKINNVSGDVIGFRVFAVNLDGTLYDPDGRAFYVKVGKEYDNELSFTVVAEKQNGCGAIQDSVDHKNPILAQNQLFAADKTGMVNPFFNVDFEQSYTYTYDLTWGEDNPEIQSGGRLYTPVAGKTGVLGNENNNYIAPIFTFYNTKSEKATYLEGEEWKQMASSTNVTNYNVPTYETNNMAVMINNANSLQDGKTYNLVLTIKKGNGNNAYSVVSKTLIKVTKYVPEGLPKAFKVKETLDVFAANMKFYLRPINETATWDITSWFDPNADDFGASALTAGASYPSGTSGSTVPWDYIWGDGSDYPGGYSRATRAPAPAPATVDPTYRWATDVRPYNFEEIFAGLIDANNNFDQNYTFVFEGCGDIKKDLEGTTADAISTYRMYNSSWIDYTGVNAAGTATKDMHPGYYLPTVFYQVIDKYNSIANGKYVAVKAGYTYKNVSLVVVGGEIKKDANGNPVYDKVITPKYFKADGTVTPNKAEAGFKATFYCAVHEKFHGQAGRYKVADFKEFTGSDGGQVGDGTADTERTYEFKTGEYIPYAYGFTVTLDSIGVNWTSNLAALTSTDPLAKAAAYFRTNFDKTKGGFTSSYTTKWKNGAAVTTDVLASEGISYYNDSLYAKEDALNGNVLKSKCNNDEEAKWLKLADLSDVAVDFNNSTIEQLKADGTKDKDTKLTAATLAEYFIVTSNGNTVTFKPKTIAIDPTKIGQMSIKVKATAKLIHQWGHVNSYDFTSGAILIGKPHSAENTNGARQRR